MHIYHKPQCEVSLLCHYQKSWHNYYYTWVTCFTIFMKGFLSPDLIKFVKETLNFFWQLLWSPWYQVFPEDNKVGLQIIDTQSVWLHCNCTNREILENSRFNTIIKVKECHNNTFLRLNLHISSYSWCWTVISKAYPAPQL